MPSAFASLDDPGHTVDRVPFDPRHAVHRDGHVLALDHEQRPDEVVRGQGVLAHHAARPVVPAHSAHTHPWIGALGQPGSWRRGAGAGLSGIGGHVCSGSHARQRYGGPFYEAAGGTIAGAAFGGAGGETHVRQDHPAARPASLPESREHIARFRASGSIALARARRAKYWTRASSTISTPDRLDDPEEWAKVPILDKEKLRETGWESFNKNFGTALRGEIAEFAFKVPRGPLYHRAAGDPTRWSSRRAAAGTGRRARGRCPPPVLSPRVHPAGQLWARTAYHFKMGVMWVGSGVSTPTQAQPDLIRQAVDDVDVMPQLRPPSSPTWRRLRDWTSRAAACARFWSAPRRVGGQTREAGAHAGGRRSTTCSA